MKGVKMLNNKKELVALFQAITMNGYWSFQAQKGAKQHESLIKLLHKTQLLYFKSSEVRLHNRFV